MDLFVGTLGIGSAVLVGGLFFWLIPLKLVNRTLRRFGWVGPCPYRFAWLLSLRPARWFRSAVLKWIAVQHGNTVLEIGPGFGIFTVRLAKQVCPDGRLIALDIQAGMLSGLRKHLRINRVQNVHMLVADACRIPLSDESIDHVILGSVLGEIPDQCQALCEIRRVLKPSGMLSVCEDFFDPDYLFRRETIRLAETADYLLSDSHGNVWLYALNFRKSSP